MNFQKIFDGLPHVRTIWVKENGDYYLVPRSNCQIVNRGDIQPSIDNEVQKEEEVETISKKKKKNK